MTRDDIYDKVKGMLVEALAADDDAITPAARLRPDLNAESIDILEIQFRLERGFGLDKLDLKELFPEPILQRDPAYVADDRVTPVGIRELRDRLPFADPAALAAFEAEPSAERIDDLLTVDLIVRLVEHKLAAKG